MPKSHLRKILLIVIIAILILPLLAVAKGLRYYKMAKRLAYRLTLKYWPVAYPLAWWN